MQNKMKVKKQVQKYIARQDRPTRESLAEIIRKYPSIDTEKLTGRSKSIRARYGKFRIVFEHNFDDTTTAIMAGVRGDIYKHLRSRRKRIEEMRKKEAARYARKFG